MLEGTFKKKTIESRLASIKKWKINKLITITKIQICITPMKMKFLKYLKIIKTDLNYYNSNSAKQQFNYYYIKRGMPEYTSIQTEMKCSENS